MKRQLTCYCEHRFEEEIPEKIDLSLEPKAEEAIVSGSFQSVSCPRCGKLLKPEFPARIVDPGRGIDLFFVPELDRYAFLRGKLAYPVPEAARVVVGYEELVEKLRLKKAGIDDRLVEILKYYYLDKALETAEEEEAEVRFLFQGLEGESFLFHVRGIKKSEIAVLRIPAEMIRKAEAQLKGSKLEDTLASILKPPYVSINKLYAGE